MIRGLLKRIFLGPNWQLVDHAQAQPHEALSLPAQVALADTTVSLRLMAPADGPAILAFAGALPPHDLLFLRRDITRPDQVDLWLDEIAKGLTTTVLALHDGEIIGYATVASEGLSWTSHVRELRVMVGPAARGKHIGRLLTEQAFAIAREQGAKKMVAQMTTDQRAAIEVFASMGFEAEGRLRNQVIDRDGQLHDLQIMSLDIEAFEMQLDYAIDAARYAV